MKLTKEHIQKTKNEGEKAVVSLISMYDNDNSKINFILENLGSLPKEFKGDWLFKYSLDNNYKLRMSAIRNIGKLKLNDKLPKLYELFENEPKTEIKREIVSSVGRQRNTTTVVF